MKHSKFESLNIEDIVLVNNENNSESEEESEEDEKEDNGIMGESNKLESDDDDDDEEKAIEEFGLNKATSNTMELDLWSNTLFSNTNEVMKNVGDNGMEIDNNSSSEESDEESDNEEEGGVKKHSSRKTYLYIFNYIIEIDK